MPLRKPLSLHGDTAPRILEGDSVALGPGDTGVLGPGETEPLRLGDIGARAPQGDTAPRTLDGDTEPLDVPEGDIGLLAWSTSSFSLRVPSRSPDTLLPSLISPLSEPFSLSVLIPFNLTGSLDNLGFIAFVFLYSSVLFSLPIFFSGFLFFSLGFFFSFGSSSSKKSGKFLRTGSGGLAGLLDPPPSCGLQGPGLSWTDSRLGVREAESRMGLGAPHLTLGLWISDLRLGLHISDRRLGLMFGDRRRSVCPGSW